MILAYAPAVGAAEFTVDSAADDGAGSLRAAILQANATAEADTIVFELPADSTITLATALPEIDEPLTIDAGAATGLTVQQPGGEMVAIGAATTFTDLDLGPGDVDLLADQTLTALTNRTTEIESNLIGDGGLTKQGTSELTLSGLNTYTGGTLVEAGTLTGDTDSLQGEIEIDAQGTLRFKQAADGAFTGTISGEGKVEKVDLGELTLGGTNSWEGGTTINGGALVATTPDAIPGDVVVGANGDLVLDFAAPGEYAGAVSGAGGLVKRGANDVTLTGAHSNTGGTTIEQGLLIGPATAFPGDVAVAGGATLVLDQAANTTGTLAGKIDGDGALVKRGAGTARLTGANEYTGSTTVEAGTLSVTSDSLPGDAVIQGGARLAFDQASDGAYADVLSGAGSLQKLGTGRLTLSGAQTLTGGTTVSAGTLDLTGTLPGDVTVESGGRLEGSGTASGAVTLRGVVAPGSGAQGLDTLGVGSLAFEPGGALEVQIDPSGVGSDLLNVAGTVDVGSGALRVDPLPGDYTVAVVRQILTAGTVNGDFADPEPFLLLDVTLDQTGDQLTVTLQRNAQNLGEIGTPNQNAVGAALVPLEGDPAFAEVFENLNIVTTAEGGDALDSIGGEPISAFTSARVASGEQFQRMVHRRLRGAVFARQPSPLLGLPSRGDDPPPWRPGARGLTDVAAPPAGGTGLWFDASGLFGGVDGDGNSADAEYWLGGATLGADAAIGGRGRVGLALGYARIGTGLDEPDGEVASNTAQAALYAGYATPRVHAGVSGRYAWSRAESERDVEVGDLAYRADGDFDSHDFGARAELAFEAFPNGRVSLQPLAGFTWGRYQRESFDESGADVLSLDVDEEEIDTATLQVGARAAALFAIDQELSFAPELRAFWIHEFGDLDRQLEAELGGIPFTVVGAEAERDGMLVGAGWDVVAGTNVRASLAYDARFDANLLEHVASVSLRVDF